MAFSLPPLPYATDALAPLMSRETLEFHYGKHHKGYVDKLNLLIKDTDHAHKTLEEIIRTSSGSIFNNAAQVWNHTFFWNCMAPEAGGEPSEEFCNALIKHFGSVATFKEKFSEAAMNQFGSGWAWLVKHTNGELAVISTANADNPLTRELTPLLTCDVWEHAYYIDYRNERGKYVHQFWNLVNWEFVDRNWRS